MKLKITEECQGLQSHRINWHWSFTAALVHGVVDFDYTCKWIKLL